MVRLERWVGAIFEGMCFAAAGVICIPVVLLSFGIWGAGVVYRRLLLWPHRG